MRSRRPRLNKSTRRRALARRIARARHDSRRIIARIASGEAIRRR